MSTKNMKTESNFEWILQLVHQDSSNVLTSELHQYLCSKDQSVITEFLDGLEICKKIALQSRRDETRRAIISQQKNDFKPTKHDKIKPTNEDSNDVEDDCDALSTNKLLQQQQQQVALVFPVEVLHQVCQSDFLTVKEIGRLLFLVSKSAYQSFGSDRAWELVCHKQWRSTSQIPKSIVDYRGYEWMFRHLQHNGLRHATKIQQHDLKIPSAQLSHDKLILLISIRDARDKEVVSLALKDEPLKTWLETGELNISLPDPVSLGSFTVSEDGVIDFDIFCTDFIHWNATLHLIRLDKKLCICVHRSTTCSWGEYDYCEDPNFQPEERPTSFKPAVVQFGDILAMTPVNNSIENVKPLPVEVDMGYLEFSSDKCFEFTITGKALEERIRAYENQPDEDTLQSIKMEPTLLCFTKDFQPSLKCVELCFSELRLDIWKRYKSGAAGIFHSIKEAKRHGITLFHLLDHMCGWHDDE